jgi:hypothetical protein
MKYARIINGLIDTISFDRPQMLVPKQVEKQVEVWVPEPTEEDPNAGHTETQTVTETVTVQEDEPGWIEVPDDAFAGFSWDGEVATPPPALPAPIPNRVSRRQFKMQLAISGLSAQVTTWVAAQDELVQIAFNESGEFARDEPMMQAGFAALGFAPEQIDAFFTAAAAL